MEKTDKEYMVGRIIRNIFQTSEIPPDECIRILKELTKTGEEALKEWKKWKKQQQ